MSNLDCVASSRRYNKRDQKLLFYMPLAHVSGATFNEIISVPAAVSRRRMAVCMTAFEIPY